MPRKTIGAELIEAMKDALAFTKGKRAGYRVHVPGNTRHPADVLRVIRRDPKAVRRALAD